MFLLLIIAGCSTPAPVTNNYYETVYEVAQDTGPETVPATVEDTGWQEIDPPSELDPTVTPEELALDPFAQDGVVYWFDVSETQVAQMNADWQNGDYGWYGPLYSVDDEGSGDTYADHLYVFDGTNSADYGKVQATVVGQSSGTTWTTSTIPNLSLDSNEFVDGEYFDYAELLDHGRLNNESVGSMIGEPLALSIWDAAGYAVPRTSYAYVGGTPWQDDKILVPYAFVEVYKPAFCADHADFFGGGCANIWEWYSYDISAANVASINQFCETHDGCTTDRLSEFADAVDANAYQEGFEAATAEYFDWPAFQTQMCLSWYAQTGDDYVHNLNNIVMIEGDDGKFRVMPWSTDINAGLAWGGAWTGMDLWGYSTMSVGCEYDSQCWQETVDTCNGLLDQMEALDPANTILPDLYERLRSAAAPWGDDGGDGMLRSPDAGEYAVAYEFYSTRVDAAREELAAYVMPDGCSNPYAWDTGGSAGCGDTGAVDTATVDTGVVDTAVLDTAL